MTHHKQSKVDGSYLVYTFDSSTIRGTSTCIGTDLHHSSDSGEMEMQQQQQQKQQQQQETTYFWCGRNTTPVDSPGRCNGGLKLFATR